MSNLYGAISDFTLPAEDFPNNTELLNEKYVPLKYHVQALFNKPWDREKKQGKDALITFIPGYNVTDKEAGRKLLDSISTFTETVGDYHLGLYGRFATASNLLYAIKLLNDHNLHVNILILTHGGKDVGMYTRDAGGMIINAKHLEYIEEKDYYFDWDLKVSKVIGLYCHAKDNMERNKSVLRYFKGKGAVTMGITGSPNSMDFFQQVQDILTGGVWHIKDVEVKYPVMVGDVKATWVMKEEDQRLNQAFGEKGAKIDNVNMLIGGFLSGFLGVFSALTGIKIYQGEIEDAIGNVMIDHGQRALGKSIKRIFGFKIPLIDKSIGQALLEWLLAGGITTVIQTIVNLIIKYIMKMVTNYIAPWLFQLFGNLGKFDIVEAFGFRG